MINENKALSYAEMEVNAKEFYNYMSPKGFNKWSVFAMLGNMQTESTINPGRWEIGHTGNTNYGYGLTQWTPATKIIDWQKEHGFQMDDGVGQMDRIVWECFTVTNAQWLNTSKYPYSFSQFAQWDATEGQEEVTLKLLADMFLKNYERPKNQNQPARGSQAVYWWKLLDGMEVVTPPVIPENPVPIPPDFVWVIIRRGNCYVAYNEVGVFVKILTRSDLSVIGAYFLVIDNVVFIRQVNGVWMRTSKMWEGV